MTAIQKEKIMKLREKGESYGRIAAALGISENTIKSFCRRNNLGGNLTATQTKITAQSFCKQCGKEITQIPKQRTKKFCSFACRMDWWKTHTEQVNQKAIYQFICLNCKTNFTSYGNKNRKYCSHACYINFRFGEKAGG